MCVRGWVALFCCVCWGSSALAAGAEDTKQQCVTAADEGQAQRDAGKYAASREQFAICAQVACPEVVAQQCTIWLKEVVDAMPTIVLSAKDGQGGDIAEAHAFADGRALDDGLNGAPLALDPGPHELRFESVGHGAVSLNVVLRAGEKNRVVTAQLPLLPVSPVPQRPPAARAAPLTPPQRSELGSARTVTSLSLLAAGMLAEGTGLLFSSASHGKANEGASLRAGLGPSGCFQTSSAECSRLADTVDSQRRDATLSTTFYVTGGILLAASAVTWFVWPKPAAPSESSARLNLVPVLGPTFAGLSASAVLP